MLLKDWGLPFIELAYSAQISNVSDGSADMPNDTVVEHPSQGYSTTHTGNSHPLSSEVYMRDADDKFKNVVGCGLGTFILSYFIYVMYTYILYIGYVQEQEDEFVKISHPVDYLGQLMRNLYSFDENLDEVCWSECLLLLLIIQL